MATKPNTPAVSQKDIQVAINNAISLILRSEDGPSEKRMVRLAQYTRAFYEPMKKALFEDEMLRISEAVTILLAMALLAQQAAVAETERKVPAQQVLDILFNGEEE